MEEDIVGYEPGDKLSLIQRMLHANTPSPKEIVGISLKWHSLTSKLAWRGGKKGVLSQLDMSSY